MDFDYDAPETETVILYYIPTSVLHLKNPKFYFI